MRIRGASVFLLLGLALNARCEATTENDVDADDDVGILECMFEHNAGNCLRARLARDLDRIELEVTGKRSEPPMSAVIERAGNIIAEVVDELQETGADGIVDDEDGAQDDDIEEARQKKGKKKKKGRQLHKLLGLVMLMKAKIGLLLQLISTHFQLKFYAIAIISLLLNIARFWIDLKKQGPTKVIYYEHAQHQHHYDRDDPEHGYWARSSNETPQDTAYRAYAPTK